MSLTISNTGLELIKKFEGCKLTAYQDSVGIWTIGYGHTSGVSKGQTITQSQADSYLKSDCANAEKAVNSYTKYNGIRISLMHLLVLLLIVAVEI